MTILHDISPCQRRRKGVCIVAVVRPVAGVLNVINDEVPGPPLEEEWGWPMSNWQAVIIKENESERRLVRP
jgi:hypothetical protein